MLLKGPVHQYLDEAVTIHLAAQEEICGTKKRSEVLKCTLIANLIANFPRVLHGP